MRSADDDPGVEFECVCDVCNARRSDNTCRFAYGSVRHRTGMKGGLDRRSGFARVTSRDKTRHAAQPLGEQLREGRSDGRNRLVVKRKLARVPTNTVRSEELLHR